MCQIAIEIPEAVLYDLKMNTDDMSDYVKKVVALSFYKQGKVSLGYCSKIAGMNKEAFIRYLSENEISIFQYDDIEELMEEVRNA